MLRSKSLCPVVAEQILSCSSQTRSSTRWRNALALQNMLIEISPAKQHEISTYLREDCCESARNRSATLTLHTAKTMRIKPENLSESVVMLPACQEKETHEIANQRLSMLFKDTAKMPGVGSLEQQ